MTFASPRSFQRTHGIYAILLAANIFLGAVILEQGQVIETQRVLIKSLFFDSMELAHSRIQQAIHRR